MTLLFRNFRGMILTNEIIFFYKIVFWVRGIFEYAFDCREPLSLLRDLSAERTHSKLCGTRTRVFWVRGIFEYAFDCWVPLSLLRDLSAERTHSKLCGTNTRVFWVRGIFEYAFDCDVAGEFLLKLCTYFRSHQISYLRLARGLNI